jgi:polyhydroxyalkanoate synthesis regulator phasin
MKVPKLLTLVKRETMNTQVAKKTLHDLIDRIEDDELLNLYVRLLEREIRKTASQDFFKTTESDLVTRAKASLKSVKKGKTRNIKEFKKDVETWKKNRAIL